MKDLRKIDKTLLILVIILSIFGLVMIFSASSASTVLRYNLTSTHFFTRQLAVLIVGYLGGFFIMLIPNKYQKLTSYFYTAIVLFLLVFVLFFGEVTNNAQSWFDLGFFSLQPSEFAKSAIILFSAFYYGSVRKNSSSLFNPVLFIPAVIAAIMFFLILFQPDWGSALIFFAIFTLIFFEIPYVKKHSKQVFKILFILIPIVACYLAFNANKIFSDEKLSRLTEFQNPCERYQEDSGYQVCNGFIAISEGGLLGAGLGQSSQKYLYLPESHTDFIFPIIVEECGLIVGILVILIYGIILFRIFKIAKEADNIRNKTIAYGTFWYFVLHIVINLYGILALMPLTGVPLPFLSYGGSYTLNAIIMIFFTQRVAIENKTNKLKKQIAKL